jgi:hypothetical protein
MEAAVTVKARHNLFDVEGDGARIAIAIFDDWATLQNVVASLCQTSDVSPSMIVFSRDLPEDLKLSGSVTRMRVAANLYATFSSGQMTDELATRLAQNPHTLTHALHDWLPLDQNWKLESHLDQGNIVFILELKRQDDHGTLCAILVRNSPHIIRLIELNVR